MPAHACRIAAALDVMARGYMTADLALAVPVDESGEALSGTHRLVHNQLRLLTAQQGPLRAAAAALATRASTLPIMARPAVGE